jgi:hypothetical protein
MKFLKKIFSRRKKTQKKLVLPTRGNKVSTNSQTSSTLDNNQLNTLVNNLNYQVNDILEQVKRNNNMSKMINDDTRLFIAVNQKSLEKKNHSRRNYT